MITLIYKINFEVRKLFYFAIYLLACQRFRSRIDFKIDGSLHLDNLCNTVYVLNIRGKRPLRLMFLKLLWEFFVTEFKSGTLGTRSSLGYSQQISFKLEWCWLTLTKDLIPYPWKYIFSFIYIFGGGGL